MRKRVSLVSVVIVVKDDRGIADTLGGMRKLFCPVPYEVVVIDASQPETLADIRQANPWAKWVQFPYSTMRSTPAQRNMGLEVAGGDLIAFIDANCVPADEWLSAMVEDMEAGEDIVCGPVRDKGRDLVHYAPELSEPTYVDACTTISVGVRRDVFEAVGDFDLSFPFGQDTDFFWRTAGKGYKIYYDPRVSITHDWGGSDEQVRRAYQYGKSRAHLFKKHWRSQKRRLVREVHVWAYPLYIIGLPVTYFFPPYPFLALVPLIKNWKDRPLGILIHHLSYGVGVIAGTFKIWPSSQISIREAR